MHKSKAALAYRTALHYVSLVTLCACMYAYTRMMGAHSGPAQESRAKSSRENMDRLHNHVHESVVPAASTDGLRV